MAAGVPPCTFAAWHQLLPTLQPMKRATLVTASPPPSPACLSTSLPNTPCPQEAHPLLPLLNDRFGNGLALLQAPLQRVHTLTQQRLLGLADLRVARRERHPVTAARRLGCLLRAGSTGRGGGAVGGGPAGGCERGSPRRLRWAPIFASLRSLWGEATVRGLCPCPCPCGAAALQAFSPAPFVAPHRGRRRRAITKRLPWRRAAPNSTRLVPAALFPGPHRGKVPYRHRKTLKLLLERVRALDRRAGGALHRGWCVILRVPAACKRSWLWFWGVEYFERGSGGILERGFDLGPRPQTGMEGRPSKRARWPRERSPGYCGPPC
jgi:hypothetical protein